MSKNPEPADGRKIVATNRKARAQYHIEDTLEAGLVLTGPEVKSLRAGNVNLQDGFARISGGRATMMNVHIQPYTMGSLHVVQEPTRTRTLLLNAAEIRKWEAKVAIKGYTIVVLDMYFRRGRAKVTLGLAKGKNAPDRRDDIKRRTVDRELRRQFAGKQRIR